jgi:hypothetical protein
MVIEILLDIQDIEKRFRMPTDEHNKRTTTTKMNPFPRAPIVEHFRSNGMKWKFEFFVRPIIFIFSACLSDFDEVVREQILNYVETPILYKSSYGILLYNSKREVHKMLFSCIHKKHSYNY